MQALIVPPGGTGRVEFVRDYPQPKPAPDEMLVRVRLAGICSTDLEIARGYMRFSGVLGHEFVGTVVEGPETVEGRRVVAEINCPCGHCGLCTRGLSNHCRQRTVLGIAGRDGVFAEYVTVPARNCHIVPETIADEQAVFIEPLAAAAHVRDACSLAPHSRVAVIGTGRLGQLVARVMFQQSLDLDVIGRNPETLGVLARHGMHTIPLTKVPPEPVYDAVVECAGTAKGLKLAISLCRPGGTIVLKSTYADPATIDLAPVVVNEISVIGSRCGSFPDAIRLLVQRNVKVDDLVSETYALADGVNAIAAAARPGTLKVLLRPDAD